MSESIAGGFANPTDERMRRVFAMVSLRRYLASFWLFLLLLGAVCAETL